jgi:hypothetical protein
MPRGVPGGEQQGDGEQPPLDQHEAAGPRRCLGSRRRSSRRSPSYLRRPVEVWAPVPVVDAVQNPCCEAILGVVDPGRGLVGGVIVVRTAGDHAVHHVEVGIDSGLRADPDEHRLAGPACCLDPYLYPADPAGPVTRLGDEVDVLPGDCVPVLGDLPGRAPDEPVDVPRRRVRPRHPSRRAQRPGTRQSDEHPQRQQHGPSHPSTPPV